MNKNKYSYERVFCLGLTVYISFFYAPADLNILDKTLSVITEWQE